MGLTRYAGPRQYVGDGPEEARQQGSRGSLAFPAGGGGSWTLRLQGFLGLNFSGFPRPELFRVSWPGFFSQHVFSGEDVSPGVVGRGIPNET